MSQKPVLPIEHIWSKKTANGWEIVQRETYSYDDQGRLVKVFGTSTDSDDRKIKVYTYISDTSRIQIDSEYVDEKLVTYQDSILIHTNGVEMFYTLGKPESSTKWIPSLKHIVVKDNDQHIIKETYERFKVDKWEPEDRMLYFFEAGQCKEEFFQVREEEDWITRQRSVHQYNKDGKLILTDVFYQNKKAQIPEVMMTTPGLRILFVYDNSGNLIERVSKKYIEGKREGEFKRTCVYQS